MKNCLFALVCVSLLSACATSRVGRTPATDFSERRLNDLEIKQERYALGLAHDEAEKATPILLERVRSVIGSIDVSKVGSIQSTGGTEGSPSRTFFRQELILANGMICFLDVTVLDSDRVDHAETTLNVIDPKQGDVIVAVAKLDERESDER